MNTRTYFFILIVTAVSFLLGFKIGDSKGYEVGYNEGYRYDCKEEIATIYSQVKAQTKAIAFTDSSMRRILHENDSLKRKEYYQKRYNDSIASFELYSSDSLKYYKVAAVYSDSINKAVGGHVKNIVQPNGKINRFCVMLEKYRNLPECKNDLYLRSRLDEKLSKPKKRGKK